MVTHGFSGLLSEVLYCWGVAEIEASRPEQIKMEKDESFVAI